MRVRVRVRTDASYPIAIERGSKKYNSGRLGSAARKSGESWSNPQRKNTYLILFDWGYTSGNIRWLQGL